VAVETRERGDFVLRRERGRGEREAEREVYSV